MDLTFRLPGPWGSGKGSNLQPTEVDNNFWSLAEAIVDLQSNPAQPVGIESISVSGTQMTITLTDGTVMGPFTLPVLTFRWRGEWVPGAVYAELDVFTVLDVGIFMALLDHTSGATFDPDIAVGGEPALQQLFGSTSAALSGLSDVALTDPGPNDGDVLVWNQDTLAWNNERLGNMAFQDAEAVIITGGAITGMPSPVNPFDVVNKAYVDALPGGVSIPDFRMMANIAGMVGPALPNTLTDFLDYVLGTPPGTIDRGTLLFRGGAGWLALPPGTSGNFLRTSGAGADPAWAAAGAGVTSITAGTGIDTVPDTIVATGSVGLAAIADDNFLANTSGASAAPVPTTLTAFLDSVLGTARGTIVTRTVGGWVSLAPGLTGQYLKTLGSGADLIWDSPAGAGTVTSVASGAGLTGGPITGSGTLSLAAIATSSLLANISGGSAAPGATTPTLLFDAVFGTTQGAVLYRSAAAWVMLTPGTSGQVLTTAGGSANPVWANPAAGAPIATATLLSNISGSTAAAAGNTLSNIFDSILGSSRGMLVYRGAGGWVALPPGTAGQVLTTGGPAGNPSWAAGGGGGASITVADTPPASPAVNSLWFDSAGGQTYLRYDDGTSVQWVPVTNQPGPQGPAGTNANISGMTAGQIAIAGNITSITSSIPTSNFVATAGGTMSGALTIAPSGGYALLQMQSIAGTANLIRGNRGSSQRWEVVPGDGVSEAGSNSGTNFNINRYSDAGAALGTPLTINRATGNATFSGALTAPSVRISGNYLYLNNATGPHNGVGTFGPLVYGDGNYIVTRSTAGVLIKNESDVVLFSVSGGGNTAVTALLDVGAGIGAAGVAAVNGSIQAPYVVATVNISAGTQGYKPGGGTWADSSDIRTKEADSIADYTTGLAAVLQLNPVTFKHNGKYGTARDGKTYVGLIANDVVDVMPEMVSVTDNILDEDGKVDNPEEILSLEATALIYALVNSVKELSAKVQALEAAK